MGLAYLPRRMRRILRVGTLLLFASIHSMMAVAGTALDSKGAPGSAIGAGDRPLVSRLVVRFQPDVHPPAGRALGDPLLSELQLSLGRSLGVAPPTRAGNQILTLAEPVSVTEAKRLVNVLRLRRDVLWAELDRSEVRSSGRKSAIAGVDDKPIVRRFIVTFSDPAAGDLARNNQRLGDEWDQLLSAGAGVPMHVVRPTVGGAWIVELPSLVSRARAEALAAKLESTPGVRYAVPDYPVKKHAYFPSDSYYQNGYQRDMANPLTTSYYGIDAPEAWDLTTGSNLVVAVVDTGVRPHIEIASRLLAGYDFISDPSNSHDGLGRHASGIDPGDWSDEDECGDGESAEDSDWHGTHVAGIIAATGDNSEGIAGINWHATILPVRVLGTCGGDTSDILEGMMWAAGLPVPGVPNNPTPAKVINMSLGGEGPCDDQFQAMVDAVLARGTFIAVSAGNDSIDIESQSPANCFGLSTVAATDPYGYLASYSNYSVSVDIAAPGGDQDRYGTEYGIWSTINSGTKGPEFSTYGAYQGTSQAAPHVSGVASLMLSVNPTLTPAQIKAIMAETSSYFASDSECRTNEDCGAGIVNAYYAVKEALRLNNYQGLWFNPSESGWGINFAHQGDTIFASWFTFDSTGKARWLVMTANMIAPNSYGGTLFTGNGPPFDAVPFPPLGSPGGAVGAAVGPGTITFNDLNNATLTYTINGITQSKAITRQLFGPQPICTYGGQPNLALATNFTDLWWAAPGGAEAGWGINLTHQGDIIFATWFTFDHDGTAMWLVVQATKTAPGVYSGSQIYKLIGPPFSTVPFPPIGAPGGPTGSVVGAATFRFTNGNAATFTYTVDGVTQSKAITREVFAAPGTTCQ